MFFIFLRAFLKIIFDNLIFLFPFLYFLKKSIIIQKHKNSITYFSDIKNRIFLSFFVRKMPFNAKDVLLRSTGRMYFIYNITKITFIKV